jgi:hypothetical protein
MLTQAQHTPEGKVGVELNQVFVKKLCLQDNSPNQRTDQKIGEQHGVTGSGRVSTYNNG